MSAFIGQSLLIVCLVVLLLMGTCRAEDDLKNWLDHCSARNQTNPDSFLGRTACTLNCMRHYQIKDGKVSDDGLVCATDMQFACRDGLCRTGSQSTLVLDNVYNKGLDDIKISLNSSKSYFTICLGDLTKGQTIHDVQVSCNYFLRKFCISTCLFDSSYHFWIANTVESALSLTTRSWCAMAWTNGIGIKPRPSS